MSKWDLKYHKRRYRSLDETNAGPILRLAAAVIFSLAAMALIGFVLVPLSVRLITGASPQTQEAYAEASPAPTPSPTPELLFTGESRPLSLDALFDKPVLDASFGTNRILFVTGDEPETPDRLYAYDLKTEHLKLITAVTENGMLRNPVEDNGMLTYEDVSPEGGGTIRVRSLLSGGDEILCGLRYDAPKLYRDGDFLAYTARTGEDSAELYLVDVERREGVTAARFLGSAFGSSEPCLWKETLVYAEASADGRSAVVIRDLADGAETKLDYSGTPHDPKAGNGFVAFLSAPHGEDASLFVSVGGQAAVPLAGGVLAFAAAGDYLVYAREGVLYAALPGTNAVFTLTDGTGYCRLLAAGTNQILYSEDESVRIMTLETKHAEG